MNITPIPIDDDKIPVTYGIYLHGLLEKKNGFDMVNIDDLPKEDGMYDCIVTINDVQYTSMLFYWTLPAINGKKLNRGYIVAVGDVAYMADAQQKFERRAEYI